MFESDADRESLIKTLGGGARASCPHGEAFVILEEGYAEALLDPAGTEGTQPYLVMRHSDVDRLRVRKGVLLNVGERVLKVTRLEPDGTGVVRAMVTG